MRQAEGSDAGSVDHRAATWQRQQDRRGGSVPPLADLAHVPDRAIRVRDQPIDQTRLAHPRMTDQHTGSPLQPLGQLVQRCVAPDDHCGHGQHVVGVEQLGGITEIALRQAQQRIQPRCEGGDQTTVDETGTGRRICDGRHHHQLVGVGDHDSFGGIGVVGRTP